MKKSLSLLLLVALLLSTAMLMVSCNDASEGLRYHSNGDGTCYVYGENESASGVRGNIVIPETSPDGERVTKIGSAAFSECRMLKSVIIPNSVTTIENSAFSNCIRLDSITITDSVINIGSSAFKNCPDSCFNEYENMKYIGTEQNPYYALIEPIDATQTTYSIHKDTKVIASGALSGFENIVIPDSVISIGSGRVVYSNSGLKSITIGDGVKSIAVHAFLDCTDLTSVTIGNSVTSIGRGAFKGCTRLTSIKISDSVTSIGEDAFWGCDGLTSIKIPDSVTSIGEDAFWGCDGLTSVVIGSGVTSIGEAAFYDCRALTDVYFAGTEQEWADIAKGVGISDTVTIHYNNIP